MGWKGSRVIGKRVRDGVRINLRLQKGLIRSDELIVKAVEGVDVDHHAVGSVDTGEVIAKEFLSEAGDHVNGAFVRKDSFDVAAIAEPIKVCTPEKATELAHGPAASGGFAGERVKKRFLDSATARAKMDGPKTGTGHKSVEEILTAGFKGGEGVARSFVVGGLHEDEGHASAGPVSFQEDGEFRREAGEAGVGDNGLFQVEEARREVGGPGRGRNGLAMMAACKCAKGGCTKVVLRNVTGVEACKTKKR